MQNLQYLKITDIDPLCYADDISLLLLGSKRLRDMKLHWSPRMREHREPSVHQAAYFGKIYAAGYSIPLRSIAIQNLYTHHGGQCYPYFDNHTVEEVTLLNSTGGLGDDGGTEFMDKLRWHTSEKDAVPTNLKMLRIDKISRQQCEFLASIKGLEKLYLIGPHARPSSKEHSNGATPLPHSPVSSYSSASSTDNTNIISLKDDYIEAIAKNHGRTLRHLLLLPQWRLTDDDIALIVRQCPNLEQVGIGAEFSNCKHLRLLVPFLANLTALRLLGNPDDPSFVHKMRDLDGRGMHIKKITEEAARLGESKLRFLELGADDMIFKIDRRALYDQGVGEVRKAVRKGGWEDVKDVDIWAMDSLEI